MAIITKKDFKTQIDTLPNTNDVVKRLSEGAIKNKVDIKTTQLTKLHGIKTEVVYYEQIVSDRQGNLANNAPINQYDVNTIRFRKISNMVILTDQVDVDIQKEEFTNMTFTGTAKILPGTIIPNLNDHFIMKVFGEYHLFRVHETNPSPIEKDSGYEITFKLYRSFVDPNNLDINKSVKESYTFDYNHVGTEFRTVFKNEEYEFINTCRSIMGFITENYVDTFYNSVLNTIVMPLCSLKDDVCKRIVDYIGTNTVNTIGSVSNSKSIFDIYLVEFINKFDLLNISNKVFFINKYYEVNNKNYNNSIYCALERDDVTRYKNKFQRVQYANSNKFYNVNRLSGRFIVDYEDIDHSNIGALSLSLFPDEFNSRILNYNSDTMNTLIPIYTTPTNCIIDIISIFLNEKRPDRRLPLLVKFINILYDKFINSLYSSDYDNRYEVFYIYPILLYIMKHITRELSLKEFKG